MLIPSKQLKYDFNKIPDWETATLYKVGYAVFYNNAIFICTEEHTSGATLDYAKFATSIEIMTEDVFSLILGTNDYTLSGTPIRPNDSLVFINGQKLKYNTDYTISADVLTLIPAALGYVPSDSLSMSVHWS